MDIDVRYCRRERHELGPLRVQDPKKTEPTKIDIDFYEKKGDYYKSDEIVTLVYFWDYPADPQSEEGK